MKVAVTGGTGFLGAFLIFRLLKVTDAHLFCLTRSIENDDASIRFWERFSNYFGITFSDRITVVEGDILKQNLSIKIKFNIDTVYHIAGAVSHYGKLEQSLDVNFNGTKNVMDWSIQNNVDRFNYFSTVAVSGLTSDDKLKFFEMDLNYGQNFSNHIYSKSKFLSEKYISDQKADILVNIFRLGNIGGRFKDGLFQYNLKENNIYTQLIALSKIGMYTKSIENLSIDLLPVDKTINSVVDVSLIENKKLNTFHFLLKDTYKISDIVMGFHTNGVSLKLVDDDTFQNRLEELNQQSVKNYDLNAIKILFYTNRNQRDDDNYRYPEIITEATHQYLNKQNIKHPYDKTQYLFNVLNYLITNNLI